jgi:hypothetical protein
MDERIAAMAMRCRAASNYRGRRDMKCPARRKAISIFGPTGLGNHGLVQQTDQIAARFAITIYP